MGKIRNFLNKTKQSWKEIIVVSILLALFIDYILAPLLTELRLVLSSKPEVEIYIYRTKVLMDINEKMMPSYPSIGFIGGCGVGSFFVEDQIRIPEGRPIYYDKTFAGTSAICKFGDGSPCYYFTINIKNVGQIESGQIIIDGAILADRVEFTNDISQKIQRSGGSGFFENGGFYLKIDSLDVNETVRAMIKASSLGDVNMKCDVMGRTEYCSYGIIQLTIIPAGPSYAINYGNEIITQPEISNEPKIRQFFWNFGLHRWDINKEAEVHNEFC